MSRRVLIADIGGSSSRWAWVLPPGEARLVQPLQGSMPGCNLLSDDGGALLAALQAEELGFASADVVHVYAAGCGDPQRRQRMRDLLTAVWPAERIHVESDLLGAARSLFGTAPGRVLVLGTGMSAAHYDGAGLQRSFPSLGALLGDEGSGAAMGRRLVRDAIYGRMPQHVREHLFGPDGPQREEVLHGVYASGTPGRFLAAPVVRLQELRSEPYVEGLFAACFGELAEVLAEFFAATPALALRAVGSVAWGFREPLAEALGKAGLELSGVERAPLRGLALHHG